MLPVARRLTDGHRVIEPFQRASGDVPLTVAQHIQGLHGLICSRAVDSTLCCLVHPGRKSEERAVATCIKAISPAYFMRNCSGISARATSLAHNNGSTAALSRDSEVPELKQLVNWCGWGDLNSHALASAGT